MFDLQHACSSCGGPLELIAPLRYPSTRSSEYRSLGESETPILELNLEGVTLLKLDSLLPTGSFKDRGSAVMVGWLADHGASRIVIDSSGNAGASVAAYAARHGLACTVFAPATASSGKLTQIQLYGAQIVRVEGTRGECASQALRASRWEDGIAYGSHAWSPAFLHGTATFAFEVVEQLGAAPDAVIVPVGAGTLLLGAARGFAAMKRANAIERLPRMIGVQSVACAPLAKAFERGIVDFVPVASGDTAAEGVKTGKPPRGREVLEVVYETGGALVAVTDEELWAALRNVGAQGVNPEPTAAVAVAGALKLRRNGELQDSSVVIALTGNGLKASAAILQAISP